MSYTDFLERKRQLKWRHGLDLDPADIHPMLHGFQRETVLWAGRTGRSAVFLDCGMGKTFVQVEWARLMPGRALIVAPLSVARQTVREAVKIGVEVVYSRDGRPAGDLTITNYEMAHLFDPADFQAIVLDESSILKNVDGRTRQRLTEQWRQVEYRMAATATPAPNDVAELTNHAEFLGVMSRAEMLAAYFVNDEKNWRLKGHASDAMYRWMATWATAARAPSDLGWPDDGYVLPKLSIAEERVHVEVVPEGQLFATDLGGIGGRAAVRRETLDARVERTVELVDHDEQAIVWVGLNDESTAIARRLGDDAVEVKGSDAPEKKAEALEAFQDGQVRVLVTKPSIAGFGMNFQNTHRMVFCGIGDSYEAYYQAIRRSWRFGQTKPVDVRVVVSDLESQVVANVRRKEREAGQMVEQLVRAVRTNRETAA